jgi:hypothetical protein
MNQGVRFGSAVLGVALVVGGLAATAGAAGDQKNKHKGHQANVAVDNHPGIGAKVSAWKDAYGASRGCLPNSCFGPGGRNTTGTFKAEFVDVQVTGGIVTSYTENFPSHTDITSAEAYIEPMLPGDPGTDVVGTPVVVHNGGTCARWDLTFPTLGAPSALGSLKIGDTPGTVGIELTSPPTATSTYSYNPDNVTQASVGITASGPTIGC